MDKLVIIGTGVNAKHLYRFVQMYKLFDVIGFAVDSQYMRADMFLGKPVYELDTLCDVIDKENVYLFVAMLWNKLNADRMKLYNRLKGQGYKFANVISTTAIVRGNINGDNCWVHDYVIIQNDAQIGSNNMIMAYSIIGTDAVIGDHCFLGAKSTIAGGCSVGNQTFIGINATVFDDTNIGNKCIIGACTAVKRNVPNNSLYKTSSDIVIKQYDEEQIEEKLCFRKNKR